MNIIPRWTLTYAFVEVRVRARETLIAFHVCYSIVVWCQVRYTHLIGRGDTLRGKVWGIYIFLTEWVACIYVIIWGYLRSCHSIASTSSHISSRYWHHWSNLRNGCLGTARTGCLLKSGRNLSHMRVCIGQTIKYTHCCSSCTPKIGDWKNHADKLYNLQGMTCKVGWCQECHWGNLNILIGTFNARKRQFAVIKISTVFALASIQCLDGVPWTTLH